MSEEYAIVGNKFAKVRQPDGSKLRVAKKAHIIRDGRSVCKVENGFTRTPRYTYVLPKPHQICKLCLDQSGQLPREPRLSVLLGQRMAE